MSDALLKRLPFKDILVIDFEYCQSDGALPDPLCVAVRNARTGERIAHWLDPADPQPCPYNTGPDAILVAHAANAECLCHRVLNWPVPTYVLDTYAEARASLNGGRDGKAGLLDAAARYRIPVITAAAKSFGREIAMQGRAYAEGHRDTLLRYCMSDVDTNADLMLALLPEILERQHGMAHAIGRGLYTAALSGVEQVGVPFDVDLYSRLQTHWQAIKLHLIETFDTGRTDCFVDGVFSRARFAALLTRLGLISTWPLTPLTGWPSTAEDVFKDRTLGHPILNPLWQLYYTLGRLKKLDLPIGPDQRHRARTLGAFRTNTGRNAPQGFCFAPAVWVRHLIRPEPGTALVYADYSAQEPHIAARLSGDPGMIEAVTSGDCYLWFGRRVGLVPADATKASHGPYRDRVLKPFYLSVNYAAEAFGIAHRIGKSVEYVEHELLTPHKRLFHRYWQWSDEAFATSMERELIITRMGWPFRVTADTRHRSLRNHRIQAAGADILRLAITALVANGVAISAPVHDAVLAVVPIGELEDHRRVIEQCMRAAAVAVIGHPIPVDCKVVRYPDHYSDPRGVPMFETVMDLLSRIEGREAVA